MKLAVTLLHGAAAAARRAAAARKGANFPIWADATWGWVGVLAEGASAH